MSLPPFARPLTLTAYVGSATGAQDEVRCNDFSVNDKSAYCPARRRAERPRHRRTRSVLMAFCLYMRVDLPFAVNNVGRSHEMPN